MNVTLMLLIREVQSKCVSLIKMNYIWKVQNKIHFAVHEQTAAEVIFTRADAEKEFMGLMTFSGSQPHLKCWYRKKLFKRKTTTGIRANCFGLSGFCGKTSRTWRNNDNEWLDCAFRPYFKYERWKITVNGWKYKLRQSHWKDHQPIQKVSTKNTKQSRKKLSGKFESDRTKNKKIGCIRP